MRREIDATARPGGEGGAASELPAVAPVVALLTRGERAAQPLVMSAAGRAVVIGETLAFLEAHLPRGARVLDVGCGDAAISRSLAQSGRNVTGIDVRIPEIARSHSRLDVVETPFLEYRGGPFDAIVFVTSLHHLYPLGDVLAHTWSLVRPGGVILFEDFALEAPDAATTAWFYDQQDSLDARHAHAHHSHDASHDPLARWRAEHAHEGEPLHRADVMLAGLRALFGAVPEGCGPFLYRYLAELVDVKRAREMLAAEIAAIDAGALRPVGRRWIARRVR